MYSASSEAILDKSSLIYVRYPKVIDFNMNKMPLKKNFRLEYRGKFYVATQGTYTFFVGSDDGSRLTVDDEKIVERWEPGAKTKTGKKVLRAGWHDAFAEMF